MDGEAMKNLGNSSGNGSEAIKGPQRDELLELWGGRITLRVRIAGQGPPLVYFHPLGGLYWDRFLDRLAETHTVYAPEMPGTTPGDPYAIHKVDSYLDLLLIYEEALRRLTLAAPQAGQFVAVGQSMGGMVACDLAAIYPALFARLVALAPCGLWRDDAPSGLPDLYVAPPEQVPQHLFHDPASTPGAAEMLAPPQDPDLVPAFVAQLTWNMGCAGKFLWPFPDHGLRQRLHRITAPTLILWGEQDRVTPAAHAPDFAQAIPNATLKTYPNCGHIIQMERLEQTNTHVQNFLR